MSFTREEETELLKKSNLFEIESDQNNNQNHINQNLTASYSKQEKNYNSNISTENNAKAIEKKNHISNNSLDKQINNLKNNVNKKNNDDINKSYNNYPPIHEKEPKENKNSNLNNSNGSIEKERLFFENNFDFKINKIGFYVRFFICTIGLFFIALNSITNCLVTEEESEGMRDKIIETLIFYTNFLRKDSNIFSKLITIGFAFFYDAFISFGIISWILYGKSNRAIYSSFLFFSLMVFLQNLFLIEMPLVKDNFILLSNCHINSVFLNLMLNKHAYYNGHIGFLLIILFEIQANEFKTLFYVGSIYLVNLIAYLMALHSTNSLCVISALLAALYFDKIAEVYICKQFDVIDIIKNMIKNSNNGRDDKKEALEIKEKSDKKFHLNYDENLEECERLKNDNKEEYEKYTLNKNENNICKKNSFRFDKDYENRLNEKLRINDFLLLNKNQAKSIINKFKLDKKRSFDFNLVDDDLDYHKIVLKNKCDQSDNKYNINYNSQENIKNKIKLTNKNQKENKEIVFLDSQKFQNFLNYEEKNKQNNREFSQKYLNI